MENDTIAAIATPVGSSGIGIVRISGPNSIPIAKKIFTPGRIVSNLDTDHFFQQIDSHHLYHGYIHDPVNGGIVDEVMLVSMKAPRSYTREDVVEIQSHSGSVILSKILQLTLEGGSRLAEPGEFTKRAFLNGRIDLSQAEAIADMITAKTESGLKLAATHLTGTLRDEVRTFIDIITKIQVELEASIEFPEEVDESIDSHRIMELLERELIQPINNLVKHYDDGHVLRDGIRLDIVGRPNVGKSSLLNAMIKKDKAIVTDLPGTTRDLIEDYISIDGVPIVLTDTAGLHNTDDPVEIIGIQKTKDNIQKSDLVLLVVDGGDGFLDEDHLAYGQITDRNTLLVINKLDLMEPDRKFVIPESLKNLDSVKVSAKFGQGLEELKRAIKTKCINDVDIAPGRSLVPNFRQKAALERAAQFLQRVMEAVRERMTEELIVFDLNSAKDELARITGENIKTDILDDIFGKFCIGK